MTKYIIRIEDASGMDLNGINYSISATTIHSAILKALMKDKRYWHSIEEAKELMKECEKINKNTWMYGGDTISVEVTKVK